MQQYADVITDLKGNVVPGALVSILNLDGSLASLFATNGSTAIGNPVTTDSTGYFVFRAANGNYKRRVTAAGVSFDIPGEIVLYASGNEAVAASEISNTPIGNVNATTVQQAINELESEKVPFFLLNSPSGAAQVGTTPAGSLTGGNVQAALNELDAEKVAGSALADDDGSGLVGHGAGTVGAALDAHDAAIAALQLADYTALRAYAGPRKAVYVTGFLVTAAPSGVAGLFVLNEAAGAVDNGGTVIVGAKKWKRVFDGDQNAYWFGVRGGGVANDTAALQLAVNVGAADKRRTRLSADMYLLTDTITAPVGTQIIGETGYQYGKGFDIAPKATSIDFKPTTERSLFVASGTNYSGFRFHYSIENLYISGNSTTAGGLSKHALDLDGVIYGRFENIGIEGFQTPIRCSATINNRFVNIYASGKIQAVLYAGNLETTDVWDQCTFWGSPVGVTGAGESLSIRFNHCLFEQIDTYGVNLARENQNWIFNCCYCEDAPYTNNAAGAMFRVGYLGTTLAVQNHLTIIGGTYNGRNAGVVGSFIDADYCNGVILQGVDHNRFTSIIKTSANTRINSIVVSGGGGVGWTTYATDMTKVVGMYPSSVINSGTNTHLARLGEVQTASVTASDGGGTKVHLVGGALQFEIGPANAMWATSDNTKSVGISSNRWSGGHFGTAITVTSDERLKQQIKPIDAAALRAWSKVEFCQFKYNDAVTIKGDGARWHFGVIAQRVKEVFESEGLDPFAYGVLCFDEWPDTYVDHPAVTEEVPDHFSEVDAEGQRTLLVPSHTRTITEAWREQTRVAGNRYGIRYEEALALECAYLRSRLA